MTVPAAEAAECALPPDLQAGDFAMSWLHEDEPGSSRYHTQIAIARITDPEPVFDEGADDLVIPVDQACILRLNTNYRTTTVELGRLHAELYKNTTLSDIRKLRLGKVLGDAATVNAAVDQLGSPDGLQADGSWRVVTLGQKMVKNMRRALFVASKSGEPDVPPMPRGNLTEPEHRVLTMSMLAGRAMDVYWVRPDQP